MSQFIATHLVLIGGLAGCGKSSLGREVARQTGFAFYDKDTLTRPLVEVCLRTSHDGLSVHDRESEFYLRHLRPAEYTCLTDALLESIELGVSAIGVAPFLKEFSDRDWRDALDKRSGAACRVHYVWVHAVHEIARLRLIDRGAARDAAKLSNWDEYLRTASRIRPLDPCYRVDSTSVSAEKIAAELIALLALNS